MNALYYSDGKKVCLGSKIAQGGEGIVYSLAALSDKVAKIYKQTPCTKTQLKLRKLVSMYPVANTAWPCEIIFSDQTRKNISGYVMNRIDGLTLNNFNMQCSRSSVVGYTLTTDFFFNMTLSLIQCVQNIHAADIVIGDLNDSNILVSSSGKTTVIDCDSFQVGDLLCGVNRPEYLSPDLQEKKLDKTKRFVVHDLFSFSVISWGLFFNGTHPFAGKDNGPTNTVDRIKAGLCLGNSKYNPPPFQYDYKKLPQPILELFINAFHLKPTSPKEWENALLSYQTEIKALLNASLNLTKSKPSTQPKNKQATQSQNGNRQQQSFRNTRAQTNNRFQAKPVSNKSKPNWLKYGAASMVAAFLLSNFIDLKLKSTDEVIEDLASTRNYNTTNIELEAPKAELSSSTIPQQSYMEMHQEVFGKIPLDSSTSKKDSSTPAPEKIDFLSVHKSIFENKRSLK
jgi:serine/threonine protein kinase